MYSLQSIVYRLHNSGGAEVCPDSPSRKGSWQARCMRSGYSVLRQVTYKEIDEMIKTVDKNGDGKINYSEFRVIMMIMRSFNE